jgi:hypothetical protein
MNGKRIWYPFTFESRNSQMYRVSFLIAEEATWDHRFHDFDSREVAAEDLHLTASDLQYIQASCDAAVGSLRACVPGRPMNAGHRLVSARVGDNHA